MEVKLLEAMGLVQDAEERGIDVTAFYQTAAQQQAESKKNRGFYKTAEGRKPEQDKQTTTCFDCGMQSHCNYDIPSADLSDDAATQNQKFLHRPGLLNHVR